jgi:hypothetical protein
VAAPAGRLEGESLQPLLYNPSRERATPAIMTFGQNNHAVRRGPWRYIRYENGDEEVYNVEDDPHEWHNLGGTPRAEPVIRELKPFLPAENVPPTGPAAAVGAKQKAGKKAR